MYYWNFNHVILESGNYINYILWCFDPFNYMKLMIEQLAKVFNAEYVKIYVQQL